MYKLDAAAFFDAVTILQKGITMVSGWSGDGQLRHMSDKDVETGLATLHLIEAVLERMNVPVTKKTLETAKYTVAEKKNGLSPRFIEFGQMLNNLANNLNYELQIAKVFVLDARRAEFYEPDAPPFGADFHMKFPSVSAELDHAGKCYACDLPTAAAFHWIRCLEAGVRAITKCLGIPEPAKGHDRNWSAISKAIRDDLERRWPKSTGRMSGDAKLFDKLLGSLTAMQNPYRNETMHLDASYTATEALHLSEVVKGLMTQIAFRMDENGEPKLP